MDLQCDLPFEVKFIYDNLYKDPIVINKFQPNKNTCIDPPEYEIIENVYINLLFMSNNTDSRLYLYGLESLSVDRVELDENGLSYISPSREPIAFYSKDFYPLIPGDYLLRVFSDEKWYYTKVRISPKQMSSDQLDIMKGELENTLRGLAIDFIKKIYSSDRDKKRALPPKILREYMIISTHYSNVMAALTDLYKKINFRIRKEYILTREEKVKIIDMNTIKSSQMNNKNYNFVKAPKSVVNYDLTENRWVKYIVRNVVVLLDNFIESIKLHIVKVEKEIKELKIYIYQDNIQNEIIEREKTLIQLNQYYTVVNKMRIGFQIIINTPWYKEITTKAFKDVPHVLLTDSRYRALYQLHRDLKNEEINLSIEPSYIYQWKRTDKLYEMWGFLKIFKILKEEFAYNPTKGWIYDVDSTKKNILIPYLSSGERIVMTKNEWTIHLIYDGALPLASDATDLYNVPLYLGKNNRPDGRIDFYNDGIYVGTLIFDFKYRPLINFWNNNLRNSMQRKKEMDQIIAYQRDSRSKFLYGETLGKKIRALHSPRPVREAWAIYAEIQEDKRNELYYTEDAVRIMPLNPGSGEEDIIENLKKIINHMESVLDEIYQ